MISLPVDLREFGRQSAVQGLSGDEGRALHHFLSETFGKGAIQPFRLMPGRHGSKQATLYGYTTTSQTALREAMQTAPPELENMLSPSHLSIKTMPEHWSEGRRLAFDVRIRPVRRLKKPIGNFTRIGAEIDAWLLACLHRHPNAQSEDCGEQISRVEVYSTWLEERLAGAAHLESVKLARFKRTKAIRNGASEGPDATLHGELIISDAGAFAEKLSRGIGRHRAYGYGMLLLRPAVTS
jgi:CRISPR system Cascade subunit CasE